MAAVAFTLKDGNTVEYEKPFSIADNLIKKFKLVRDGVSEGPWMWIHPDDIEAYDNDVRDDKVRLGVCCSATLAGVPWGAIIPYELKGDQRPVCDMDKLIDLTGKPQMCKEAFEASLPELLEGEESISEYTLNSFKNALGDDHEAIPKLEAKLEKTDEAD